VNVQRLVPIFATLALALAGCQHDRSFIRIEERATSPAGQPRRPDVSGCSEENGELARHGFVVGAELEVSFGEWSECLESSGGWTETHCVRYSPAPTSVDLVSSNTDVLARNDHGGWTFVGEGQTDLVLTIDGVERRRRTFRGARAAALDLQIVAQPTLAADGGYFDVAAEMHVASSLAILRGGPGARVVVRALDARGDALCGRPPVALAPVDGIELFDAPAYGDAIPVLHDVLALAASDAAPAHAQLSLVSAGTSATVEVDVVDPSELTELRAHDEARDYFGLTVHVVDLTTWARDREVHGASIGFDAPTTYDCEQVDVRGPDFQPVAGDTRFTAEAYCGNDAAPRYRAFVAEAPSVSVELVAAPR
jgi:hypothetical protein